MEELGRAGRSRQVRRDPPWSTTWVKRPEYSAPGPSSMATIHLGLQGMGEFRLVAVRSQPQIVRDHRGQVLAAVIRDDQQVLDAYPSHRAHH